MFCFDIRFGKRFNAVRFVLLQPRCKRNNSIVFSGIVKTKCAENFFAKDDTSSTKRGSVIK